MSQDESRTALDVTCSLIACESITPSGPVAFDVLEKYLTQLGFRVWRQTFEEDGFEATENLYARIGEGAPNLCFAGHLDVVPPGNEAQWQYPPFEPTVADGLLYGRGAEDMKGAIGAYVAALSRFLAQQPDFPGSLSLLITGDEEGVAVNGTKKMLAWLAEQGEGLDACLVGEPTNPETLGEMIKIGRRGSLNGRLVVRGKQGHVAYPDLARNPVMLLVDTLNEMQHYMLDSGSELFPPSHLQVTTVDVGNKTDNVIPSEAQARFNIRFNDQHTGESLKLWLQDVCNRWIGEGHYELHCRLSGESFLTRDDRLTDALVGAVQAVTGLSPALSTTGGTSDARFIKDVCPVIEFGTTGKTAHQVNECVAVEVLEQLSRVYEQFLTRYFAA